MITVYNGEEKIFAKEVIIEVEDWNAKISLKEGIVGIDGAFFIYDNEIMRIEVMLDKLKKCEIIMGGDEREELSKISQN